ncbi:hypothetical protein PPNSA23_41500 [Phyllobacterium phragmitis]|uniref:Uncharacterized protein n=1 Tax=Phyllobacterium phragmitis TaxID=2670329 RepID=A0ABQ0H5N3_9HYPH
MLKKVGGKKPATGNWALAFSLDQARGGSIYHQPNRTPLSMEHVHEFAGVAPEALEKYEKASTLMLLLALTI